MSPSSTHTLTWSPQSPTPQCSTWLYTYVRRPGGWPARHPLWAGWWPSRPPCCGTSTGGCRNPAISLCGNPEERRDSKCKQAKMRICRSNNDPRRHQKFTTINQPAHSRPPCRWAETRPCCNPDPASRTCQWAARCCLLGRWCRGLPGYLCAVLAELALSGRCWKQCRLCTHRNPR